MLRKGMYKGQKKSPPEGEHFNITATEVKERLATSSDLLVYHENVKHPYPAFQTPEIEAPLSPIEEEETQETK